MKEKTKTIMKQIRIIWHYCFSEVLDFQFFISICCHLIQINIFLHQTIMQISGQHMKPKFSIVELVLYNIAAMLAGVASGYDVRLSNVSPLHPRLQPNR